jgi:hypothetical protein
MTKSSGDKFLEIVLVGIFTPFMLVFIFACIPFMLVFIFACIPFYLLGRLFNWVFENTLESK